jgi:hypothetical protein
LQLRKSKTETLKSSDYTLAISLVTRYINNLNYIVVKPFCQQYQNSYQALWASERVPATVTAVDTVTVLTLDRDVLISHVGSLHELKLRAAQSSQPISGYNASSTNAEHANSDQKSSSEPKHPMQLALKTRPIPLLDRRQDLRVIGTLGQGSFATVLLVQDKKTNETFALKTLQRHALKLPAQRMHVMNEKRVLSILDSPFLVRLHATTKDEFCLGFVLEPCLAGEMLHFLQRRIRLPESSVRFYIGCVVLGIHAMHSKNVYAIR